jgi:uridine monophosphate synthetase
MGFFSRLENRSKEIDSLLCIGLDPHLDQLSSPDAKSAEVFCLELIDATADLALAYKPNSAFFEVFGQDGISALKNVISEIPEEIPVILDAKRGDIASSAQAYAEAAFEILGADAMTVNPYLGYDAIAPFVSDEDRGVFLLCKTSNPGAGDIQDLKLSFDSARIFSGTISTVYEMVAMLAEGWNVTDNIGLVVGATQQEALQRVRKITPQTWFLSPGVGAQGGDLSQALKAGLRSDGLGMIIPVSRGISKSGNPRQAAEEIRLEINRARLDAQNQAAGSERPNQLPDEHLAGLTRALLEIGCIKFGEFQLKSGLTSPIYIDLRRLASYPEILEQVASAYMKILSALPFDRLAALPYAAMPIATAISLQSGWPMVYPRKETKAYGTKAEIEGIYSPGERVVLIDDLATTGGSKFEAIEKLHSGSLTVEDVVVLIDRQSGASEALAESGYKLHAIFTLTQLLNYWIDAKLITSDQVQAVKNFINETSKKDVN